MNLKNAMKPKYVVSRVRRELFDRAHPNYPLLATPALLFLRDWLRKSDRVLEYGSGHSTRWFGAHCGSVLSLETNPKWYELVTQELAGLDNVELKFIEGWSELDRSNGGYGAHTDDPYEGPQVTHEYARFIETQPDRSFDLILNDGWARHQIGFRAIPKVRPGGLICWDDVCLKQLVNSPTPEVRKFLDMVRDWRTVSWDDGVHCTTAFFAPN